MAAAAIALVLAFAYVTSDGPDAEKHFIILHSNDTHCYFDKNLGMSTLRALKDSKASEGETVFVVDAGDFLQGTPYGTVTAGMSAVEVMNTVGYDVGVPGNHDFDYSLPVLLERAAALNYPLICSNLVHADGSSVFREYVVLEKGGVRLGFFGLLTPSTMNSVKPGNMGDAKITDPVEASERMVAALREMGVDMVVAVGHIGMEKDSITSDEICSKVPGIDLFIDGHSHISMEDGKAPGRDLIPRGTVIASTGGHCSSFGVVRVDGTEIDAKLYEGEPLGSAEMDAAVSRVAEECNEILSVRISSTEMPLDGGYGSARCGETLLGDLVADAFRWYSGSDAAIVNSGSLRSSISAGSISLNEVYAVLPFLNELVLMEADGSQLYEAMEISYSQMGDGGFLQVSGMAVTYDPDAEAGSRVVSLEIGGKKVEASSTYMICTSDYIANGGDKYSSFAGCSTEFVEEETVAFAEYLKHLGTIIESSVESGRQVSV